MPYHAKLGYRLESSAPVPPQYFTPTAVAALAADRPADFVTEVWPLIVKELTAAHYRRLFGAHGDRTNGSWADFESELARSEVSPDQFALFVASAVPDPADRFDINLIDRPLRGRTFADHDDLSAALVEYVQTDLARRADPRHSADHAVFNALLGVYFVLAGAVVAGQISAQDRVRYMEGEFHGLFSFLASGPPPRRLAEMLALHRAGFVRFAGPDLSVSVRDGHFVGTSPAVPGEIIADALVDARLPKPDVRAASDPVISALLADGELAAEGPRCGRRHRSGWRSTAGRCPVPRDPRRPHRPPPPFPAGTVGVRFGRLGRIRPPRLQRRRLPPERCGGPRNPAVGLHTAPSPRRRRDTRAGTEPLQPSGPGPPGHAAPDRPPRPSRHTNIRTRPESRSAMPVEFLGIAGTNDASEVTSRSGGSLDLDYTKRLARAHEDNGWDRILFAYHSGSPDPAAVAAYVAGQTERINLVLAQRPNVSIPTYAAKTFATLDHISNGRFEVHFITGGSTADQAAEGDYLDKDSRYDRTREYIQIIKQAWTSTERFDYDGKYYQIKDFVSDIFPVQQPRPRISFGGSSAAAYAVGAAESDIYALWGEPLAGTREQIASIDAAAAAAGKDRPTLQIAFRPIIAPTEELAWAKAETILGRIKDHAAGRPSFRRSGTPENAGSQRLLAAVAAGERHDRALWTAPTGLTGGGGNSTALVGTPETVAAALLDYYDLGVRILSARGYDILDDAIDFGRYVIPIVRDEVARRDARSAAA